MYSAVKQFLGALFVFILINKATAQNKELGRCPDVEIQPNFNASDFAGRWFEYARIPRIEEAFGKCIFFEYIPPVDARITINRRKISELTNKEDLHSAQATVLTNGQAISADYYDYRVVKTDYNNYAVIYACKNQALSTYHLEYVWIIARTPIPTEDYIKMAYKAIEENGLSSSKLSKTDQKNCPPPPNEELPTNL